MFSSIRKLSKSLILASLLLTSPLSAQQAREIESGYPGVLLEELAAGLGLPWGMAFIAADKLIITERGGRLQLFDTQQLRLTRLQGGPRVVAEGQGGLMDVAVGPNYVEEGWIYFTYAKPVDGEAATTLARARIMRQSLVDWQDLLVTDSATSTRRHFGSRIAFDDQGHVFFGIGDRGARKQAQNLGNHIGSIIRLNLDGSVPQDNPFVGDSRARAEIWSYGHRNPQGLLFDLPSKRLWSNEHGPRGGDEINLIERGRNYGWPTVSHGKEYWGPISIGEGSSKPGMEQARKVYIPSIAPSSLLLYDGEAFAQWRGNLFSGALKLRHLNRVKVSDSAEIYHEERLLEAYGQRIRALAQSRRGWIYLATDSGRILRLRPEP